MTDTRASYLPLTSDIKTARILSLVIAGLMGILSLAGLLVPGRIYPSEELLQSFLPNDVVNLFIGLPILLGSLYLTRRGVLVGLLLLPGALLYVVYNYIAYVFGISFSFLTVGYLVLVLLSAYIIFDLLRSIDKESIKVRLAGVVPVKIAAWILLLLGILILLREIGLLVQLFTKQAALSAPEIGVLIADLVISPLWLAGGATLLRRMPLGYASGLGLLFAGSMLFVGLVVFLLLQPVLTGAPFLLVDVVVVLIMGMICFIPFGLCFRSTLAA